ncbi:DUF3102 domain-containing protein [Staphylococcus pettenkoferi]|uniref:DUF3102 domain-containing protein n=1 Tax=Staphylococcus pettenkoferi TaxID=170573 RepID=UPI001F57B5A0|nr:DUF3102 domain-containing protein [Staphylococcus pettenkoferi]MCI2803865.1 DUF3102 domain-containing protein [Staphylococcus pettenkoferi]
MKENGLAHGEWIEWLKSINMNRSQATKFIKVSDEFSNGSLTNQLGVNVLYEIATLARRRTYK